MATLFNIFFSLFIKNIKKVDGARNLRGRPSIMGVKVVREDVIADDFMEDVALGSYKWWKSICMVDAKLM